APQALPQLPQLALSVAKFAQYAFPLASVHWVSLGWQVVPHAPAEQTWPWAHALPQLPQFWPSDWGFTQVPLQASCPVAQKRLHCPLVQTSPGAQALPQLPQFWASVWVSTQWP